VWQWLATPEALRRWINPNLEIDLHVGGEYRMLEQDDAIRISGKVLELVPESHLLSYCTNAEQTAGVAKSLAKSLKERLPGPDVTPRQLRERSWWKGLDLYIVVDDMDMIGSRTNPLAPLAPFIPQGADLGLHVIAARRTGGAARAMFEPVLQAINDMASPGVLFSGDRMEGRLSNGTASRQLPPGRALLARRGQRPDLLQVRLRLTVVRRLAEFFEQLLDDGPRRRVLVDDGGAGEA
jgi:hypothetical protein